MNLPAEAELGKIINSPYYSTNSTIQKFEKENGCQIFLVFWAMCSFKSKPVLLNLLLTKFRLFISLSALFQLCSWAALLTVNKTNSDKIICVWLSLAIDNLHFFCSIRLVTIPELLLLYCTCFLYPYNPNTNNK